MPTHVLAEVSSGKSAYQMLDEYRDEMVMLVLKSLDWNRSRTAKRLKVHRNTLIRWIEEMKSRGVKFPEEYFATCRSEAWRQNSNGGSRL